MDQHQQHISKSRQVMLISFAVFWLGLIGYAIVREIYLSHPSEESTGARIAAEALKDVNDTSAGWFPTARDPMFSWDDDEQGWMLEDDNSAALSSSISVSAYNDLTTDNEPESDGQKKTKANQQLRVEDAAENKRGKVLAVPVRFPDTTTIFRDNFINQNDKYKMQGVRFIAYDVFVPKECSGFIGCLFFMKDKDGLWYQARSRHALIPGRWNTVAADIRGGSPHVTPLGHLGQWDENQASRIRNIGITFYGDKEFKGKLLVDNFRAWLRPQRFMTMLTTLDGAGPNAQAAPPERTEYLRSLAKKAATFKDERIEILNFRTDPDQLSVAPSQASNPPQVRKFETLTLRFELNRQSDNPFDPEKADVTCVVETPSGQKMEHVGFWFQDYDRTDRFMGDELTPLGRPEWRVRITPREAGKYKYTLRVKLRHSPRMAWTELIAPERTFRSLPAESKGFVRVSRQDPRYFEFENGEFFYPIGHNLHSPLDVRCWREIYRQEPPAGRGLPMYADFLTKMQQHGENTAEVWMSAWWVGIEWTARWRDYYGPGRYSLQHAWLLDRLLQMARQRGINIHLVLDNHGKFSAWCDWEWDLNPYNRLTEPNGVVDNARAFFSDETAKKWHRHKLRYIVARWGADPTIMGWELVSEYDLVGGLNQNDSNERSRFHRGPVPQAWAKEMITFLRKSDIYRHPITNHYATDYNWIDKQLACSPLFDYVATDAYRFDRPYTGIAQRSQQWMTDNLTRHDAQKPFWITEFGGDWNATVPAALDADAHCGLWATWMTDGAGTPLFWWYDFIDRQNLYSYYRGFANYIQNEDRRGIQGTMERMPVTNNFATYQLQGEIYRWNNGAYAWIYSHPAMQMMPALTDRRQFENIEAAVNNLDAGRYRIEYWNCYDGKIAQSETQVVAEGQLLTLKFPPFVNNMAVKIKLMK
ncbi:MAG: DUF5060 domain-containing protein [Planctomycetota bacterium]